MENVFRNHTNTIFSIIIPCRVIDEGVLECIYRCIELRHRVEVIAVPDDVCPGFPAAKRNWAMGIAQGRYLAFIDADAYPHPHWLAFAEKYLQSFAAVCGPGILPDDAPFLEKASDIVLQHFFCSYRVFPKKARIVAEFPTFNLIVKRRYAPRFENYLTGEDSLFCRAIKGEILYHPSIKVYHRRRPLFKPFLKQQAIYGKHRGHLIRLALLGWISGGITYYVNIVKGFFKRKI